MKSDSSGLMARIKNNVVLSALILVLVGLVVAMVFIATVLVNTSQRDQSYLQLVSELRASSYRVTASSRDAIAGSEVALTELGDVITSMGGTWSELQLSDPQTRQMLGSDLGSFESVWERTKSNVEIIVDRKTQIKLLNDVSAELTKTLPAIQSELDNVVDILLDSNAPPGQVEQVRNLSWLGERIGRNIDKMLRGGNDVDGAADQFNKDANTFGKFLDGLKLGDTMLGISRISDRDAVTSLTKINESFQTVSVRIKRIFDAKQQLLEARQATTAILDDSPILLETLSKLSDEITNLPSRRPISSLALIGIAVIALGIVLLIILKLSQGTKIRLKETAEMNDRNQNAILRLLDELADLADGDLTTTATVTEDFTGAIADSINYTIDQLRVLVSRINETSERVALGSRETQQTALHLAEAAEHQAQEIAGASAAVNEMAVTIDQVSANASESAAVAERSVTIAKNGAKVVQNTINGMDTIREQIQDTSKRIKRLGESSQEIGDIVSLINDIADQTNILSLNAAIQASMAGDAGRGFAVVADEVQRLAERSATATKQIEALVKTIQNDTNEAVISMEQTTSEVVRGARLAQDAGVALEEIETVSASLAELIQNISNAARQQASSAGHISNTMNVIQEITSQTSAGTTATATAIGRLSDLASDLRGSVTDFKLPEEMHTSNDAFDSGFNNSEYSNSSYGDADDGVDLATLDEEVIDLVEDDIAAYGSDEYEPEQRSI